MQLKRFPKKPGSLSFGDNGAGRATQIEIDFIVTQIGESLGGPDKIFHSTGKKLRDCFNTDVDVGRKFSHLTLGKSRQSGRRDKGEKIGVSGTEKVSMHPSEWKACEAFHWGNDQQGISHIS